MGYYELNSSLFIFAEKSFIFVWDWWDKTLFIVRDVLGLESLTWHDSSQPLVYQDWLGDIDRQVLWLLLNSGNKRLLLISPSFLVFCLSTNPLPIYWLYPLFLGHNRMQVSFISDIVYHSNLLELYGIAFKISYLHLIGLLGTLIVLGQLNFLWRHCSLTLLNDFQYQH